MPLTALPIYYLGQNLCGISNITFLSILLLSSLSHHHHHRLFIIDVIGRDSPYANIFKHSQTKIKTERISSSMKRYFALSAIIILNIILISCNNAIYSSLSLSLLYRYHYHQVRLVLLMIKVLLG